MHACTCIWLSSTLMKETLCKDKLKREKVCVSIRANHFVGGTVNKRLHSIPDEKFFQFSSCVQFLCDEQDFFGQCYFSFFKPLYYMCNRFNGGMLNSLWLKSGQWLTYIKVAHAYHFLGQGQQILCHVPEIK